jgi:deaminated glutathione amidase
MRAALCQMRSGDDLEANLFQAEELIERAAGEGADLAALPEYFAYQGSTRRYPEVAECVPGSLTDRLAEAARRLGIWILGGSVLEADDGHVFGTSILFDRTGELIARYRKIHLFDVDVPGEPEQRESASLAAGHELVTADTEFGRVGLTICYDLRFPELYRGLMARGAEVLFVPSAFTFPTGVDHWHVLLRARAIENQAFVLAPAQWGAYGDPEAGRRRFGHSLGVDPWGRVIVEGAEEGTEVALADLDFSELRRIRQILPALQHRRLGPAC